MNVEHNISEKVKQFLTKKLNDSQVKIKKLKRQEKYL